MTDPMFAKPSDDDYRSALGPVFTAMYECDDACCGFGIEEGEQIRADGQGGWIHEGCEDRANG